MKKLLICFLSIAILSCSNDNDGDNSNGTLIKSSKKYVEGALDEETTYEYNNQGNISKITTVSNSETTVITFNYDGNGIMTGFVEETDDVFDNMTVETDVFTYTNLMVSTICLDLQNLTNENIPHYVDKIEYVYNGLGQPEQIKHYFGEDAEFNTCDDVNDLQFSEFMEYDANGNMIYYLNDNDGFFGPNYYTYTYDNNSHPFSNIEPVVFNKLFGFSTVNNIASAIEYNANNDEQTATISYEYEYNDNGYPTNLVRVYQAGGFSQTLTFEYSYY